MSKMSKTLQFIKTFAPMVLSATRLAPIAEEVAAGIEEAEQIVGSTGAQKLQHVKNIALLTAKAKNDQSGREVVPVEELDAVMNQATHAVIAAVNLAVKVAEDHPAPEPVAGAAAPVAEAGTALESAAGAATDSDKQGEAASSSQSEEDDL